MMVVMISVALCHTSAQPHAAPDCKTLVSFSLYGKIVARGVSSC